MSAVVVGLGLPRAAHAGAADACADASEKGQHLRAAGKLREARAELLACSRARCPAIIARDCDLLLGEVEASLPSVVIIAHDGKGGDLTDVRVMVDGRPFVDRLDGTSVAVDPGKHVFRYEHAGAAAVEQELLIHVGEKNRPLQVTLGSPPSSASPTPPSLHASSSERAVDAVAPVPPRPARLAGLVVGGVGIAALATGIATGLIGVNDYFHLKHTCAPGCAPADTHGDHVALVAGDVVGAAGIVALGIAAGMLLWRPAETAPTVPTDSQRGSALALSARAAAAIDIRVGPGGGVVTVGARF